MKYIYEYENDMYSRDMFEKVEISYKNIIQFLSDKNDNIYGIHFRDNEFIYVDIYDEDNAHISFKQPNKNDVIINNFFLEEVCLSDLQFGCVYVIRPIKNTYMFDFIKQKDNYFIYAGNNLIKINNQNICITKKYIFNNITSKNNDCLIFKIVKNRKTYKQEQIEFLL
jgi:hypothetical protein